jgi:hypothetical protein
MLATLKLADWASAIAGTAMPADAVRTATMSVAWVCGVVILGMAESFHPTRRPRPTAAWRYLAEPTSAKG